MDTAKQNKSDLVPPSDGSHPVKAAGPTGSASSSPARKSNRRLKIFLGLAAAGFVLAICANIVLYFGLVRFKSDLAREIAQLPIFVHATADPATGQPLTNHIAFVGNDNNIWITAADGGTQQQLTTDATPQFGYNFPTWSPDSRHLAFIGPHPNRQVALYIASSPELKPVVLYTASNSAPFYLYWAPNSQAITFLTQERSSLSMRIADVPGRDQNRVLEQGSPFYWVWSPVGDRLFMHVGGNGDSAETGHLSVLDNQVGADRIELNLSPGRFQAPAWSPDGRFVFFVAADEDGQDAIFRMDINTLERNPITNLRGIGRTYMVVSPDNKHIAYLEADLSRPVPLGTPFLTDASSQTSKRITNRAVASMYWSPDGDKLALLTIGLDDTGPSVSRPSRSAGLAAPAAQEIVFRWWVYDVETGALNALAMIDPTLDFLQTIPYFDQYHLSLTFWSPDSRYFVVTTSQSDEDETGAVMILDTSGEEAPRQVGEGTLAIWSWK